nr:metallophosphoesterase [Litorivivens lipolytica]
MGDYVLVPRPEATPAAKVGPACDETATEQTLRFIHVADLHARYGSPEKNYSRIKHYHKQAVANNPYTLFTNGGDDFEKGSIAELKSEGAATVEATRAMEFDVRVVGNHDFAWGADTLLDYVTDEHAQVLASNSHYQGDPPLPFNAKDFVALEVGCLTVGFFGMSSVPWNEFDEQLDTAPIPNFVSEVRMNWEWQSIIRGAISQYRDQVDVLVMVSHLGVGKDTRFLEEFPEVDLALGGHTHGGVNFEETRSGNLVLQPDFYGDGLSDLTLTYSLPGKKRSAPPNVVNIEVEDLDTFDADTQNAIDAIMAKYAPEAFTDVAVVDSYPTKEELAQIAARAAIYHHNVDAVLIAPNLVDNLWLPGGVDANDFHFAYQVERQVADTPGFNALYRVEVSKSDYQAMKAAQPTWVNEEADGIDSKQTVVVALHKAPALNMPTFFNGVQADVDVRDNLLSETWESLDAYARHRTTQCLYLDSDRRLVAEGCNEDDVTTTWQFHSDGNPLRADSTSPVSTLSFFNAEVESSSKFNTTSAFNISPLPGGDSVVLSFPDFNQTAILRMDTTAPPNKRFGGVDKLGEYTLIADFYWPSFTADDFRGILQTNVANTNDAELYFENAPEQGIGPQGVGAYFGFVPTDTWVRVGFVLYADDTEGTIKVYINGEPVGQKTPGIIGERWAIDQAALIIADGGFDAAEGYVNALLFSGRAFTDNDLKRIGGPSATLDYTLSTLALNRRVRQHQQQSSP